MKTTLDILKGTVLFYRERFLTDTKELGNVTRR